MNYQFAAIVAGASVILLSACATTKSKDKNAPTGRPTASIRFEGGQAAYYASTGVGKGTLNFKGVNYPFTAMAVGAGGTGAQKVSATGEVYNLNSLADFPGTYTGVRSGFTVAKGKQRVKLTNDKGVVIYGEGVTVGLASSTGAFKVIIELK